MKGFATVPFTRGLLRGLLLGLVAVAVVLLVATIYAYPEAGAATVAIGTIALAAATVWLGWQTQGVSRETGKLATKTTDELDLIRKQVEAAERQVELQRQTLEDAQRERHESRRPLLAWSQRSARSERFSGRLQYIADLVLINSGQIAFVERIEITHSTAALETPERTLIRTQIGPSENVPFTLRAWAYVGDQTEQHAIELAAYARSIAPGARLESYPVRIEIAAGTGGLTLQPLDPSS